MSTGDSEKTAAAETMPPAVPESDGDAAAAASSEASKETGAAAAAAAASADKGAAAAAAPKETGAAAAASADKGAAAAAAAAAWAADPKRLFPKASLCNFDTLEADMKKAVETLIDLDKTGKWESKGTNDGCEVWLAPVAGTSFHAMRGKTRIKRKPEWFLPFFDGVFPTKDTPPDVAKKNYMAYNKTLNPDFIDGHNGAIPGSEQCFREIRKINMPWPVTNRETCFKGWIGRYKDCVIQIAKDYDWPEFPQSKGYIRAALSPTGYIIRPVPSSPDESDVTYILQLDVKGSLPAWLVNILAPKQAREVLRFKNMVEKVE